MDVVSLFSGIGGLDKGFMDAQSPNGIQGNNYNIVWANDFDQYAVQTYKANFGEDIIHHGDINKIIEEDVDSIPQHHILIGGFPCQPFSIMGEQKGFKDRTRGTLFFSIAQLIQYQKDNNRAPKVIVLENVRRLLTHDRGDTYKTIKGTLKELGYVVYEDVLNSADYGVPQTRNRVFIVCFREDIHELMLQHGQIYSAPEVNKIDEDDDNRNVHSILELEVEDKYYLSDKVIPTILSNGTGGYEAKSEINQKIARPLCATMAKMHRACQDNYYSDDFIYGQGNPDRIRKLTPRECARLQGFDDDFKIVVSNAQAYKQFGNAVTVNVARAVAERIRGILENIGEWQ